MIRLLTVLSLLVLTLAACEPVGQGSRIGPDGKPLPKVYRISRFQSDEIQLRMLDSVNSLRSASGIQPVVLNSQLNAAAATHSRDMSIQNRPWHFGSDGSSPIDRVRRAGYSGGLVGENISETYETELETLAAWMDMDDTRRIILASDATTLGFNWYQENSGKIWWTLLMGK